MTYYPLPFALLPLPPPHLRTRYALRLLFLNPFSVPLSLTSGNTAKPRRTGLTYVARPRRLSWEGIAEIHSLLNAHRLGAGTGPPVDYVVNPAGPTPKKWPNGIAPVEATFGLLFYLGFAILK